MAKKPTTLAAGMSMPPIVRMYGQPLDNTSVYNTYSEMAAYAASSPLAYEGQVLVCYHTESDSRTRLYAITSAGLELLNLGQSSALAVDERLSFTGADFRQGSRRISDEYFNSTPLAVINGLVYRCFIAQDESMAANSECELSLDDEVVAWLEDDDKVDIYITRTVLN